MTNSWIKRATKRTWLPLFGRWKTAKSWESESCDQFACRSHAIICHPWPRRVASDGEWQWENQILSGCAGVRVGGGGRLPFQTKPDPVPSDAGHRYMECDGWPCRISPYRDEQKFQPGQIVVRRRAHMDPEPTAKFRTLFMVNCYSQKEFFE